jgi:hypothetical protein
MRLLPEKYTDIEKSLPLTVSLTKPVFAFYTSPITKQVKTVKVPEGTAFSISAIPNKVFAQGEEPTVNSDLIVLRGITTGKAGRVFGQFKYSDIAKNAVITTLPFEKTKRANKSLLIFGLPRQLFFVALGGLMVLGGVYYLKKNK